MKSILLAALLIVVSAGAIAQTPSDRKELLLSYTKHPIVEQELIPLLTKAYHNLGYKPEFVNIQSDRFIELSSKGLVDGDVARLAQLVQLVPQLLLVYKFDELQLMLRCRPGLTCSEAELNKVDNTIFIPANSQVFQFLQLNYKARLYTVRDWTQLTELYHEGKVDRFFWVDGKLLTSPSLPGVKSVVITTPPMMIYHVLHQSRAELVPLIQAELLRLQQQKNHQTPD